ncbi:hypothetical protein VIGAN_01202400 [Vigna angularis var. angularis]|uniref:Uncharacterized protein n=1 Tax=Vigna angularis var. angularis TaxID=157739 RepID=A0A0S3R1M3_PHAAN|nr:hypothetical protein VIGAN_01202400 [Vigna angularis var. angularis]
MGRRRPWHRTPTLGRLKRKRVADCFVPLRDPRSLSLRGGSSPPQPEPATTPPPSISLEIAGNQRRPRRHCFQPPPHAQTSIRLAAVSRRKPSEPSREILSSLRAASSPPEGARPSRAAASVTKPGSPLSVEIIADRRSNSSSLLLPFAREGDDYLLPFSAMM